jgi:hypothetical protein
MSFLCLTHLNLSGQTNYKIKYKLRWDSVTSSWADTISVDKVLSYKQNGEPWEIKTELKDGSTIYDSGFVKQKGLILLRGRPYIDSDPKYIANYSSYNAFCKSIRLPPPNKKEGYLSLEKHYYDKTGQDTFNSLTSRFSNIFDTTTNRAKYDSLNHLIRYTTTSNGAISTYQFQYLADARNRVTEVEENYFSIDKKRKEKRERRKMIYARNVAGEIKEIIVYKWEKEKWQPLGRSNIVWRQYDPKSEVYSFYSFIHDNRNQVLNVTEEIWDSINSEWKFSSHEDDFYSNEGMDTLQIITRDFGDNKRDTTKYIAHYYPNKDIKEVAFYKLKKGQWVRWYMEIDSGMNYELDNTYSEKGVILTSIYKTPWRSVLRNEIKVVFMY